MIEGLTILLIGILIVMAVLTTLWGTCTITGLVFKTMERRKARAQDQRAAEAAQAAVEPDTPAAQMPAPGTVPPHHLAAIAAAAAVVDRPVRVLRVHVPPLAAPQWTSQARLETFQSHRLQGEWGGVVPGLTRAQIHSRPDLLSRGDPIS